MTKFRTVPTNQFSSYETMLHMSCGEFLRYISVVRTFFWEGGGLDNENNKFEISRSTPYDIQINLTLFCYMKYVC